MTVLLLERHDQPEEFVVLAKEIFQDTLMRLYQALRTTKMRDLSETVVVETDAMISQGSWSEAARHARREYAPSFFEMAIFNDDFETHKKAMVLIGSLYFYELLFREVGL